MKSERLIIIGAGLTGLILANYLKKARPDIQTLLLEKSRGVGGRMATRRTEAAKFDHGAQFYTLKTPLQLCHDFWTESHSVSPWFDSKGFTHFKCSGGMTTLAKHLAQGLDIKLSTRVAKVSKEAHGWRLQCEDKSSILADRVAFTCPLPQALEILRQSGVVYNVSLEAIHYAKAVVTLIEMPASLDRLTGPTGYREFSDGPIFSIADQRAKGLSPTPAITVTLNGPASESLFALDDDAAIETVEGELQKLDFSFAASAAQVKKWRYSHPLSTAPDLFAVPSEQLFLAGDAFGGPSLNGAARSARALAERLLAFSSPTTLPR